jgi:hypothetical protein
MSLSILITGKHTRTWISPEKQYRLPGTNPKCLEESRMLTSASRMLKAFPQSTFHSLSVALWQDVGKKHNKIFRDVTRLLNSTLLPEWVQKRYCWGMWLPTQNAQWRPRLTVDINITMVLWVSHHLDIRVQPTRVRWVWNACWVVAAGWPLPRAWSYMVQLER